MQHFFLSAIYNIIQDLSEIMSEILTIDLIANISVYTIVGLFSIIFLVTSFSIEFRTNRAINKINRYLNKKPFINDDNLVEFNRLMKKIPKPMRYQWQQYMLNKDRMPSDFLKEDACLDRPFKYSSYDQIVSYSKILVSVFTGILLLFSLVTPDVQGDLSASSLFNILAITILFFSSGNLLIIGLKARKEALLRDLYYNFDTAVQSLNKAVETLPEFVDYEILFSKKEIKQGIPALQDYLEQRARYEQEQLEKAKASAIEHDKYNFEKLGISGSLVMERSLREAEYYIGNRKRLQMEVQQLESEKDSQKKSYEESNKNIQRKLRDVKESLERLNENLANATSKIDSNYIRKQQADEVKKQQSLEKEMGALRSRHEKQIEELQIEIDKRNKEIADQRQYLEKAMMGEFREYAKKVYDKLDSNVKQKNEEEWKQVNKGKGKLEEEVSRLNEVIVEKEQLNKEKEKLVTKYENEIDNHEKEIQLKEDFIKGQEARIKELQKSKKAYDRYFDADGKEFFYDDEDKPYYKDDEGNVIYYDDGIVEGAKNTKKGSKNSQEKSAVVEKSSKHEKVKKEKETQSDKDGSDDKGSKLANKKQENNKTDDVDPEKGKPEKEKFNKDDEKKKNDSKIVDGTGDDSKDGDSK